MHVFNYYMNNMNVFDYYSLHAVTPPLQEVDVMVWTHADLSF